MWVCFLLSIRLNPYVWVHSQQFSGMKIGSYVKRYRGVSVCVKVNRATPVNYVQDFVVASFDVWKRMSLECFYFKQMRHLIRIHVCIVCWVTLIKIMFTIFCLWPSSIRMSTVYLVRRKKVLGINTKYLSDAFFVFHGSLKDVTECCHL